MTAWGDSELVLAIGGRTLAGKSTVAAALGDAVGWPVASFGQYVREEARLSQLPLDREVLQELGERLITTLGWREFCMQCLRRAGLNIRSVPCIVEGVRHVQALKTLRELFLPIPVLFVYIEIADSKRNERLQVKGVTAGRGADWELHTTERDAVEGVLSAQADLLLDSSDEPQVAVDAIVSWLRDCTPI